MKRSQSSPPVESSPGLVSLLLSLNTISSISFCIPSIPYFCTRYRCWANSAFPPMDMSTEKFKSWHAVAVVVLERKLRSSEIVEVLTAETSSAALGELKNSSSGGKLLRVGDRNGLVRLRLLLMMERISGRYWLWVGVGMMDGTVAALCGTSSTSPGSASKESVVVCCRRLPPLARHQLWRRLGACLNSRMLLASTRKRRRSRLDFERSFGKIPRVIDA
jgi:hypothetical protein